MKYYKSIGVGYILVIETCNSGAKITEVECNRILMELKE